MDVLAIVKSARKQLPAAQRELLDELRVQEVLVSDWPKELLDLYATIKAAAPPANAFDGALAVWMGDLRIVAFNGPIFEVAHSASSSRTVRYAIERVAWHEYGHALSATRASADQRRLGPRLLELAPSGIRELIEYPGLYRRREVFDEVIAHLYALMVARVVGEGDYRKPEFIDRELFDVFANVLMWPEAEQ